MARFDGQEPLGARSGVIKGETVASSPTGRWNARERRVAVGRLRLRWRGNRQRGR